jgi:membrane protein
LERLLLWRIWERLLEIEFVDRSIALAAKALVSMFPLLIVVAAFVGARTRASLVGAIAERLGLRGDAFTLFQASFASAEDIRKATGVLGLVLTFLFATSFTTAMQRVYLRAWRRPPHSGFDTYWRGLTWLAVMLVSLVLFGRLRAAADGGVTVAAFALGSLIVNTVLWWFTAWWLLLGDVRARVLVSTGVVTGIATGVFTLSASVWMPELVTKNEAQFGFFGITLALISWFSGTAICVLVGACAGPVFAEDTGPFGRFIRGGEDRTLRPGAPAELPPPRRELSLRDAFRPGEDI